MGSGKCTFAAVPAERLNNRPAGTITAWAERGDLCPNVRAKALLTLGESMIRGHLLSTRF